MLFRRIVSQPLNLYILLWVTKEALCLWRPTKSSWHMHIQGRPNGAMNNSLKRNGVVVEISQCRVAWGFEEWLTLYPWCRLLLSLLLLPTLTCHGTSFLSSNHPGPSKIHSSWLRSALTPTWYSCWSVAVILWIAHLGPSPREHPLTATRDAALWPCFLVFFLFYSFWPP